MRNKSLSNAIKQIRNFISMLKEIKEYVLNMIMIALTAIPNLILQQTNVNKHLILIQ